MIEPTEVHGFDSPQHYAEFRAALLKAVEKGEILALEVSDPYGSLMFEEEWYQFESGQVWRLVAPDFPFKGVFLPVASPNIRQS